MKLSPYFEVNGHRYEIRRSRYLMCELEKIRESSKIEDNAGQQLIKLQDKVEQLDKLKRRVDELYDKYLETFSEDDEKRYQQAQVAYDKLFDEVSPSLGKDGLLTRINKAGVDNAEKLVIIALQRDEKGEIRHSKEEAEKIWCSWVDEVGEVVAREWLDAFIEHITGNDEREDDNSFLAQAKAKAEQAENRRNGLAKIGK